jgi:tetratricopeptide (TPR) repeat protein
MDTNSILSQAIQAIKDNDLNTARRLLSAVVKTDPQSEAGWVLLGHSLEDQQKKIYCFKKALSINPENETAQRLLRSLQNEFDEPSPFPDFDPGPDIPSPQDEPSPEKAPKKSKAGNILVFTIFLLLGFILIGLPLWINLNNSIVPPDYIYRPAQILSAVTSGDFSNINLRPKIKISVPTPPITLESDPLSVDLGEVPESRYERYLYTKPMKKEVTALFLAGKYAEAALLWDEILAITPDYAFGYLARAQCYYSLGRYDQRILQETREYYDRAYADLDQAIELGLELGKLYDTQYNLFFSKGNLEEYRINRELWYEMGLEANLVSIDKGIRPEWGNRTLGFHLYDLGRCEEALEYFQELEAINEVESAGIYTGMSYSYLCLKDYDQALDYVDQAIEIVHSHEREQMRAIIQLNNGQLEEALEYFDNDIAVSPNYGARRYWFRAAIYYEMGDIDQALENIYESYGKSWGNKGIQSYVLGRIAIDNGEIEEGLSHLLDAEATMWRMDVPRYYDWVVAEIERLGAQPLYPTPTPSAGPTSTPIAPLPDHLYITPTPPFDFPHLSTVNYSGTPIRLIEEGEAVNYKFHPDTPIEVDRVTALYLYLDTDHEHDEINLQYECIPKNGSWATVSNPINYLDLYPGENQIRYPDECVPENGIIYISVINLGEIDALVDDLRIKMEFINLDGEEGTLGYQ